MIFEHPKRDITFIVLIFLTVCALLLSIPFVGRFIQTQNARAAKGIAEVQLSPDERKAIEKEIVGVHERIQKGDRESDADIAMKYDTLGGLYEKIGYLLKASDAYGRALKLDPRNGTLWRHKAAVLGNMHDMQGAREAYGQALAVSPMQWEGYAAFADFTATTLGDTEEARGIYLKGLIATSNSRDLMRAYVTFLDSIGATSESEAYKKELSSSKTK